ncbi:hypothetical protein K435DRAFT_692400 [Dendrothele bispora CBS 962.96]|uniref:Uncharacterized protein n=1 Tax=Dendrothele bispora (strain CBS 962.96) TaxID=1314807 RepID=A0A4S8L0T4_DENBC|nr:hypothetical protein K435DRAFT_692400 [Dendrothele bispora CBS 962.96]
MNVPTSATQAKDRLYSQLASSFGRMNRALNRTADLCEQLQVDLNAIRIFSGLDAAKFMAVAASLNPDDDDGFEQEGQQQKETRQDTGRNQDRS